MKHHPCSEKVKRVDRSPEVDAKDALMVLGCILLPDDPGRRRHQELPEQLPHVLLPSRPGRLHARTLRHLILVSPCHSSERMHLQL